MKANDRRLWKHVTGCLAGILLFGAACDTTIMAQTAVTTAVYTEGTAQTAVSEAAVTTAGAAGTAMTGEEAMHLALAEAQQAAAVAAAEAAADAMTKAAAEAAALQQAVMQAQAEAAALASAQAQAIQTAVITQAGISLQEFELLAALIQCEAGGESYLGQVAVGNVVMNRVQAPNHPNTIAEVIYAPGQFSPVRNGSLRRTLESGNIRETSRQAALEAIAGSEPVGDKLFFRRNNGRHGQVIGNHVFY